VLVVEERPDPVPGPGQVVVAVEAAGVNFVDALFVAGGYQIKPALPFVPGSEIAGTVAEVGPDVTSVRAGDRVFAMIGFNGFAERALVPAASLTIVPGSLTMGQAASFAQSYCTAYLSLARRAEAGPGSTVLVLGAGGGVGRAAVDVATALGARVLAVASSPEKRAEATAAGAEEVLDPAAEPVKDRARAWAGGSGVDVVVDPVGGDLAEAALRALGEAGRYLVIGFASGTIPRIPLNLVLLRNRRVLGVDWGAWAMAHADAQGALLAEVCALAEEGRLDPVEPTAMPLDQAARALEALAGRQVAGKLVLVP
jgi:NADPH2:quinone reductase